jgi:flagellar biosynthesis protein FlhF
MHTFSGATSREVLQKVKQALGDDALILSNKEVEGVIEVVALAAAEATFATGAGEGGGSRRQWNPQPVVAAAPEASRAPAATWSGALPARPEAGIGIEGILSEIQTLKSMLRHDIGSVARAELPQQATAASRVSEKLLNAGFTPELSRTLSAAFDDAMPPSMEVAAGRLQALLKIADPDEVIDKGGVYAVVGPTGVGKTTTVAKLAARCVVRFGASQVALLTTDSYRIGAYDQLRIYARILGVAVHAVRDADDLAATLAALAGRHLVLIDTIGMSQRDRMVAEQAATLAGSERVKRLLLVQATTNRATLDQVITAYKQWGVHGCIVTKADEAATLGPALDGVIRHELALHYVTDGQRVPEDLQLPDAATLVREALHPAGHDGADLTNDDAPLLTRPRFTAEAVERARPAEALLPMPKVMRALGRHAQPRVVHG